jgi:nucleotide-binding universal stress UspA family protein
MYKHILIPTDGSQLSSAAIEHGITLAKAINARVTALTVSTPFHTFAVDPGMITDTPDQYKKRTAELAAKYLAVARDAAAALDVPCECCRSSTIIRTKRSSILRRN